MSTEEEAMQIVRDELCKDCDCCSEDMRNEIDGCAGFQEDFKETLLNFGPLGAGS